MCEQLSIWCKFLQLSWLYIPIWHFAIDKIDIEDNLAVPTLYDSHSWRICVSWVDFWLLSHLLIFSTMSQDTENIFDLFWCLTWNSNLELTLVLSCSSKFADIFQWTRNSYIDRLTCFPISIFPEQISTEKRYKDRKSMSREIGFSIVVSNSITTWFHKFEQNRTKKTFNLLLRKKWHSWRYFACKLWWND